MTYRIEKTQARLLVVFALLFAFCLGIQMGIILAVRESEVRLDKMRESLEETATWEP